MPRALHSATQRRHSNSYYESTQAKIEQDIQEYARKLQLERRRLTNLNISYKVLERQFNQRKQLIIQYNKSLDPTKNKLTYTKSLNAKKKTDFLHQKNDKLIGDIQDYKLQITELRRQRQALLQNIQRASNDIEQLQFNTRNQNTVMITHSKRAEQAKQQIASLREKMDQQQASFRKQFKSIKHDYEIEVRKNFLNTNNYVPTAEFDNFDTGTLLKRRLQSIIVNNKQKIKMIDNYQRNMRILDDAFNTIKQTSGLTNINEIEAIFVKSEEQNCSLLTYLDTLNQQIDALTDENQELFRTCKEQEEENKLREIVLNSTPQLEKKRQILNQIAHEKIQLVNQVNNLLNKLSPKVIQTITSVKGTVSKGKQTVLNAINYQKVLGELDDALNTLVKAKTSDGDRHLLQQALQIDTLPEKERQKQSTKILNPTNIDNAMQSSYLMYDYNRLQQIATQNLKKQPQKSKVERIHKKISS